MKMLLLPIAISVTVITYGWSQDDPRPDSADSQYEKISIEEILNKSEDPEMVKLSGEIIKKIKCSTYLFKDETGEIRVQIDDDSIPRKGLLFNSPMTIKGLVEPALNDKPVRVDADKLRYFF